MTSTPQTLSQFVHEHTFYIPDYKYKPYKDRRLGYAGRDEDRHLENVVVDRAVYINYGERIFMDGCEKEVVTFFLHYLALLAVGKVQGHEELSKLMAELDFAKLKKKFLFEDKEYAQNYRKLINKCKTFANNDNLTLEDLFRSSKRRYIKYSDFSYVFECYVEEIIKFSSKPEGEEDEVAECYTLTQQYEQLQSHLIVSIERNDLVLDSKKTLTIVDIFESKLATYNKPKIMEIWQTVFEIYGAAIIGRYFSYCSHSNFSCSFLDRLESEINALAEKASDIGFPQPQIGGVLILLHRLYHIYFYPLKSAIEGDSMMLIDTDQERVSDLQFNWVLFYIDFLAKSEFCGRSKSCDNLLLDLYFIYLDGLISLEEYLACLHALWVSVAINTLCDDNCKREQISAYYQESFNNLKSNRVDFAKAFQESCRHIENKPEGLDGKTPLEAANFLVNQALITKHIEHFDNLYRILNFLHTHKCEEGLLRENVGFLLDIEKLMIAYQRRNRKVNMFRFRKRKRKEETYPSDYRYLGNCVFVTNGYELYECKTQEERIAYIYSHLPFDQNLPPQGTEITKEVVKQRTINIVAQLLEVMDFDRTEHLRLAD